MNDEREYFYKLLNEFFIKYSMTTDDFWHLDFNEKEVIFPFTTLKSPHSWDWEFTLEEELRNVTNLLTFLLQTLMHLELQSRA